MAAADYILVLDAGSGSCRAVIFDREGREISLAQREWLPTTLPEYPGSQVFDTATAWRSLCFCIREVVANCQIRVSQIVGISATSMREGMVLYDRHQREIWACPNVDARATQEVVEMLEEGVAPDLYRIGGDWLSIISPPRFRWLKKYQPELLNQVAQMSMISDWILFKLSGEIVTDPTIGSSSGLFDLKERTWSETLILKCGLPQGIYPRIVEPGTIAGGITREAAEATGLLPGTPVVVGGGDTQLALAGTGNIRRGDWALVGGTFWQTTVVWDHPLIDPQCRPRTLCHVTKERWMTEAIAFLIGQQARWFRDGFCQEEISQAAAQGADPYFLMESLAAQVPAGSNGVIGLFSAPHNSKSWRHAAPSFLNFDIYRPARSGKAECIRALWESAVYAAYSNLLILEDLTKTTPERITFCGGAARSSLWPQMISDIFGISVETPETKEATSLGCAMCVGIGAGRFRSFSEAADCWVRIDKRFDPDPAMHSAYAGLYERWRKVYAEFMHIVDQGLLTSMWKAPGT